MSCIDMRFLPTPTNYGEVKFKQKQELGPSLWLHHDVIATVRSFSSDDTNKQVDEVFKRMLSSGWPVRFDPNNQWLRHQLVKESDERLLQSILQTIPSRLPSGYTFDQNGLKEDISNLCHLLYRDSLFPARYPPWCDALARRFLDLFLDMTQKIDRTQAKESLEQIRQQTDASYIEKLGSKDELDHRSPEDILQMVAFNALNILEMKSNSGLVQSGDIETLKTAITTLVEKDFLQLGSTIAHPYGEHLFTHFPHLQKDMDQLALRLTGLLKTQNHLWTDPPNDAMAIVQSRGENLIAQKRARTLKSVLTCSLPLQMCAITFCMIAALFDMLCVNIGGDPLCSLIDSAQKEVNLTCQNTSINNSSSETYACRTCSQNAGLVNGSETFTNCTLLGNPLNPWSIAGLILVSSSSLLSCMALLTNYRKERIGKHLEANWDTSTPT